MNKRLLGFKLFIGKFFFIYRDGGRDLNTYPGFNKHMMHFSFDNLEKRHRYYLYYPI